MMIKKINIKVKSHVNILFFLQGATANAPNNKPKLYMCAAVPIS